jgi:hypothetical protein
MWDVDVQVVLSSIVGLYVLVLQEQNQCDYRIDYDRFI